MPYISDSNMREMLKPVVIARSKGELNYQIFMCMKAYLERQGEDGFVFGANAVVAPPNYDTISDALSACIECAEEFRRRILIPYEEKKIEENGDIL